VSVSAEVPLAPDPKGPPESSASDGGGGRKARQPARPLFVTGGIAALAAAASGLAVLVTLTAVATVAVDADPTATPPVVVGPRSTSKGTALGATGAGVATPPVRIVSLNWPDCGSSTL